MRTTFGASWISCLNTGSARDCVWSARVPGSRSASSSMSTGGNGSTAMISPGDLTPPEIRHHQPRRMQVVSPFTLLLYYVPLPPRPPHLHDLHQPPPSPSP